MDNAGKLIPELLKGLLYLVFVFPFVWVWQRIRQKPGRDDFQRRVQDWMQDCFGPTIAADKVERNHRFLEEALELVQSLGCTEDEALALVRYVFGRSVGDPPQEVGGVTVTLAALCSASDLDMEACAETELERITRPEMVVRIREKQKRKPAMSPLPGSYPERLFVGAGQQERGDGND